ncbi:DMT family transporter [Rhodobacteraceae bacterium N5(2021)]|uniref:DMT family transporter n=1 Tax=Gymnodinialimonas phycosphaerae TaxID=2841589 RepID=A0A975TYQ2_9RHOB|nr:DMT family transporter [Gymnodinialimonas phycosphaerae]MBY4892354.1 DMT family transporter [Gymnodinialimonas phycosphaerae]
MSAPVVSVDATPVRAIALILIGMACISVNDMLIKLLSGGYPLHQMVFIRSVIGIMAASVFVWLEGGWRILKTERPGLHLIRALLIVSANMIYFAGLSVLPLGLATALFFVAPLFITLLAIPVLGEAVGRHRITALFIGFTGVAVMMLPATDWSDIPRAALLLPVIAAACYAGMQVMTRKLGAKSAASAMAIYIQLAFIVVSCVSYFAVGHGRYAEGLDSESLIFLLRAWVWPAPEDIWKFAVLGAMSAIIGYCLSAAYRLGNAATVASYEYAALPMAIMLGWIVFAERPGWIMLLGTALIAGAGLYVFARERHRAAPGEVPGPAAERPLRRG